jgi:PAS domain S-box-containing protein
MAATGLSPSMRTLKDYLLFIKENRLTQAARENLRMAFEMKLPIMEAFKNFPEEILLAQAMKSLSDFADSLEDGTYFSKLHESMKKWESGVLEGLAPGTEIQPKDLVLIYALQRKTLTKFLPDFTRDVEESDGIRQELDNLHTSAEVIAIETLFRKQETSARFLDSVLENIPNMIFVKDAKELRFVRFNKAGEELLGISKTELLGKSDLDFFPPDQAEAFIAKDREVLAEGKLFDIPEEPIDTRHGRRWLHTRKIPLVNSAGATEYLLGISDDITVQKNAMQALRENEERFRLVLDGVRDYAIFMIDPEGYIVSWNTGAQRIKGYTPEEAIGKHISLFYTPEANERDEPMQNLRIAEKKGSYETEGWRVRKNGERFWANVIFTALYDHENKLRGFAKITRDETERKQAEDELLKSNERFFKIFNLSPVATIITEKSDGKIIYANDAYIKLFGFEKTRVIGKTSTELKVLAPEDRASIIKLMEDGRPRIDSLEVKFRTVKGEEKDLLIHLDTLEMDGRKCYVTALLDISERKKTEERMLKLNEELQNVNKELEAFTYSVSHDLRAPLRAVNGYANMIQEDYGKVLDEEGGRLLDVIRYNAEKMGRLIDDLLAFSRLGRKELDLTKEDMNQLVDGVLIDLGKSNKITADIRVGKLHAAKVDYGLMHQVMLNLISNAVKYSSKNPKPVVEIASKKENNEIIFSVKDNGVGFDMKYADKLFGVFQRLHSMEEFEGTGVGLAIVQRIVNKHNGRVWAEAKKDEGATFYIALPAI